MNNLWFPHEILERVGTKIENIVCTIVSSSSDSHYKDIYYEMNNGNHTIKTWAYKIYETE